VTLPKAIASGPSASTPDAVRPVRVAIGAGVLTAFYVLVLFLSAPVPLRIVAMFGGAQTDVERHGGLEMVWLPPAGMSDREITERFHAGDDRAQLRRDNDAFVISVPRIKRDDLDDAVKFLGGEYKLEFHRVLRVDEMKRLVTLLNLPISNARPVDIDIDQWRPDVGGDVRTDYYLVGTSLDAIDAKLREAVDMGWQLPPGTQLAFEYLEGDTENLWRTYVIDERAELDGNDIANATATYDPNTNRPLVLLDFTDEGAEKFGQLTSEIVGEKLATMIGNQVYSAPIINGAIRGGRASITMGGSDAAQQERERDLLVNTLRAGALPTGGKTVTSRYVEPVDDTAQQWIARAVLALGAGALIALLVWMVVRITRPVRRQPIIAPDARFAWSRVFVTLLAPVALYAVTSKFVLGINAEEVELIMTGRLVRSTIEQISLGALGIMPVINAFIFVEVLALIVPGWRRRRHAGPDARAPITAAVVITAGTLLFLQAWFITQFLYGLGRSGAEVLPPGGAPQMLVIGSLMFGTLVLAGVAALIREHGFGNGYGVLIASGWLLHLADLYWYTPKEVDTNIVIALVTAIAIAIPIITVLRWRIARLGEPPLRLPTSGIAPLGEVGGLVVLLAVLSKFPLEDLTVKLYDWTIVARTHHLVLIGLVVTLGLLWSFAFARPAITRRLAERVGLVAPSRATWWSATGLSIALLLLVGAASLATTSLRPMAGTIIDAMTVAMIAAVGLDIIDDVRARRVDLLRVWSLHQAQYADLVVRALDDAGIPCHLSSANLNTLLAFFGPFAPIDVWVSAEHAPAARERLRELFE
jgi:hypothetical protein